MSGCEPERLVELKKAYASCYGAPVIRRVDPAIFTIRYFTHCLRCDFCHDACCSHGVDFDLHHVQALKSHAKALEKHLGISAQRWFRKRVTQDPEMPGGGFVRTRVAGGACIFLDGAARGCRIHSYAAENGMDYHQLKPIVDCLFPITFCDEVLCPAEEVDEGSLICLDTGPTLYEGLRDELRYYFGEEFVLELDALASSV